MNFLVVTNNALVRERHADLNLVFVNGVDRDVIVKVRDYVHAGHSLLTHPLSGSLKPGETPFRSILVSAEADEKVDQFSLHVIGECQQTLAKFRIRYDGLSEAILDDFRAIDLSLIDSAIPKAIADRQRVRFE